MLFDIDPEFDLRKMTPAELDMVPFDVRHWCCGVDRCLSFSKVKCYGNFPLFYWRKQWIDPFETFRICGKHWKQYAAYWKSKGEGYIGSLPEINNFLAITDEEKKWAVDNWYKDDCI